jgi:nucleotide-binding universal stress UspA family protein
MKAFHLNKILIPIDFSETALLAIEHAAYTAQPFKAELILLHVVERHWEKFSILVPEMRVDVPGNMSDIVETKLQEIATGIREKYDVKATCIASEGNIFSEIISVSREQHVDMIMMGTHGTSGFVEFFIGSNTYKVVTQAECPVISVQSHATRVGFKEILLPIDNSFHSRQKVSYAVMLAKQFKSRIHIAGLVDTDEDETEKRKFEMKLDQIETYLEKSGVSFTRKTLYGTNQAHLTADYAKEINPDLIVIMTDQDVNITGRLMGTYAQQIVNHSKYPVMSIMPREGYIEFPSLGGGYHGA